MNDLYNKIIIHISWIRRKMVSVDYKKIINDIQSIVFDIEKFKKYRKIGYIFIPLIIGFYLIKIYNDRINEKLQYINSIQGKLTDDIKELFEQTSESYNNIIKKDTYVIYSQKSNLLGQCKNNSNILSWFLHHQNYFDTDFNSSVAYFLREFKKIEDNITRYNDDFIKRRKNEYDYLFKKAPFELNDEQKTAIITDDKHNLVVAGAGSGKTEVLINRIAYLIERKPDKVKDGKMLALAFQRDAAEEMKIRLKKRYGLDVKIKTFHALGLEILRRAGTRFNLYGGDNFNKETSKLINKIFTELLNDISFQKHVINYMKQIGSSEEIRSEEGFATKEEFYRYMKNLRFTCLDGTKVKSLGEKEILNFFLTHKINGKTINIEYEPYAEWMNYVDEEGKQHSPTPDFFLSDFDIYIEHWSIDKNGNVPPWYETDYLTYMEIKKIHFQQQDKYSLVETTFGEFANNPDFNEIIKKRMTNAINKKYPDKEFYIEPIDYFELIDKVWEDCGVTTKALPSNLLNFIVIAKTYNFSPKEIENRLHNEKWSSLQYAFANVAIKVYTEYEKHLKSKNNIDFADMINLAVDVLKEKKELFQNAFDQILIDEYQDISTQRYRLITVLMDKNPNCKLFCVGDDWQSIMGFAGANLDLFINFGKYFDHPARTDLKTNFRSIKSIVDTGSQIIQYNKGLQLKKKVISTNQVEKPIHVYSFLHNEDYRPKYHKQAAEHCIDKINELIKNGNKSKDIMVLTRIFNNPIFNETFLDYANKKGISYMSVHRSKGLQSKIVFILNVNEGLYGFPCQLEDPSIYEPAKEMKVKDKEAEERRLFYVAITRAKEDVYIYNQKCTESKFIREIGNRLNFKEVPY